MGDGVLANAMGRLLGRAHGWIGRMTDRRSRLNRRMKARASVNWLAGLTTAVCGLLAVLILFVPNYLGMGNDGIASEKMRLYALDYLDDANPAENETLSEDATNAYFTRVYEMTELRAGTEFSLQSVLVAAAKALDWLFTQDRLFDIRFLALLYWLLYLPGVYLILKAALEQVTHFSEAVVLCVLGGIIFSDISYIAYFNSLYADALFYILLLYMAGCALLMHRESKFQNLYALLLGCACMGFCLTARRGYLGGIVMAFFLFMELRLIARKRDRVFLICVSGFVLAASVLSFFRASGEFVDTGKYHAMTRGVLLQSSNPARTLEDMGISASYSVLADDSLYEYYPATQLANPLIQEEFLSGYSQGDIALHYVSHPGALLSMWDLGVKAAVNLRRDYCGNYEKSVGMPPMGKSLLCSTWSLFKERSVPRTIGYLMVLAVVVFVTTGRKLLIKGAGARRADYTFFMTCASLLILAVADMTYVIMHSGDAQLIQYNIVPGAAMDILLFFVVAQALHKLNILEDMNRGNLEQNDKDV